MTSNPYTSTPLNNQHRLGKESKTMVIVAWGLLLAGWVLMPVAPIAAIIVAAIASDETLDYAASAHYAKLKSTFWNALLGTIICVFLYITVVGIFVAVPLGIAISIFVTYRGIKGVIRASENQIYY